MKDFKRFFIIAFFTITVIPLLLMFLIANKKIEEHRKDKDVKILSFGYEQLKSNVESTYGVKIINDEIKSANISVTKETFNKLMPAGPFKMNYFSVKDGENTLVYFIDDKLSRIAKPKMGPPPERKKPERIRKYGGKKLYITDDQGNPSGYFEFSILAPTSTLDGPRSKMMPLLIILIAGLILSRIISDYIDRKYIKPFLVISDAFKPLKSGIYQTIEYDSSYLDEIKLTFEDFNNTVVELKEKAELKNSFIENLTHDLKTPLIAQNRAITLMLDDISNCASKETYELCSGLKKNNDYLLKMVDLILESYRIDFDKLSIYPENINLYGVLEECRQKLYHLADDKQISFNIKLNSDSNTVVYGDYTSIVRVFMNLISNSLENIPSGSSVVIDSKELDETHEIIIEDNGCGISDDELSNIFDKYYYGKTNKRKIGSGIGLYVCKVLVEKNGGTINVSSQKDNYTRFTIRLPKGKI